MKISVCVMEKTNLLHPLSELNLYTGVASVIIWMGMFVVVHILSHTKVVHLVTFTGARGETIVLERFSLKCDTLIFPVEREGMWKYMNVVYGCHPAWAHFNFKVSIEE